MAIVSSTTRGQITFRKEFFQHLGIKPGEKLEFDFLPDGQILGRAPRKNGKIEDVFGMLAGKSKVKLTIEEIKEATERAWAGEL